MRCGRHSVAVGLFVGVALAACGGEAREYAGTWKRALSGEGEVQMNLAANGKVELMMPAPRWPDSVDIRADADVKGDTLVFRADSASLACSTADARYVVSREADQLRIAGVGMDSCGGRRAALVGTWTRS